MFETHVSGTDLGRVHFHLAHDKLVEHPLIHSIAKCWPLLCIVVGVNKLHQKSLIKQGACWAKSV